jgi:hypothetical protein
MEDRIVYPVASCGTLQQCDWLGLTLAVMPGKRPASLRKKAGI